MKFIKRKWDILVLFAVVAIFCTAAFAGSSKMNNHFADGAETKTSELTTLANVNFYGGSLNKNVNQTDLTYDTEGAAMNIYGGGWANPNLSADVTSGDLTPTPGVASVVGNVKLRLSDGSLSKGALDIVGGCNALGDSDKSATGTVTGNVNIIVDGPVSADGFHAIIGGGHANGAKAMANVNGNINIDISKGTFKTGSHSFMAGGGSSMFDGTARVMQNTKITISGGSLTTENQMGSMIFGGGLVEGSSGNGIADVGGSAEILITGGVFEKIVLHGGGATINSTGGQAKVGGGTKITLSGKAALTSARGILRINGGGYGGDHEEGNSSAVNINSNDVTVSGTRTLVLENLGTGTMNTKLQDFDVVILKGSNELTLAYPLSADVKTIKVEGDFATDTKVLTLAAESAKPQIVGTNAKWDGLSLIATKGGSAEPEKPAEPVKPVFDEEIISAISNDVAFVAPVVSTDKAEMANLLVSTDITSTDLETDASGQVVLARSAVVAGGVYSQAYTLPVFTAAVPIGSSAKVISCTFSVSGENLLAPTPAEVVLMKYKGKDKQLLFTYSDKTEDFKKDGYFTIQTSADKIAANGAAIVAADSYKVTMFIEDNKDYDLDPADGKILDPAAIVKKAVPSSGGSGGCSAGWGILALLAVVPVILRKRQK